MAVISEDLHGPLSLERVGRRWQLLITPHADRLLRSRVAGDIVSGLLDRNYPAQKDALTAAGILQYLLASAVAEERRETASRNGFPPEFPADLDVVGSPL